MQIFNAESLDDVSNLKSGMTQHMYMKNIITPRKVVFLRCLSTKMKVAERKSTAA